MKKRDVIHARVPLIQDPFIVVNGSVYVSLLWGFGSDVTVSWRELRKLLANSRGTMVVARRLTSTEQQMFHRHRADCDIELHATIVNSEKTRWRKGTR